MMFYTSDLHHSHKRITEFTDRKLFTSPEEHNEWLRNIWNSQVTKSDICTHLGDFSFSKKYDEVAEFVSSLNGQKRMIKGNHDRTEILQRLKDDKLIQNWSYYDETKINKVPVVLFHFPILSWHKQGYGSISLFGHCVDMQTEILTTNGWKNRDNITINEQIVTYNIKSNLLENDNILDIIDVNYSGDVVTGNGKSYDFRFTADHTDIVLKSKNGEVCKIKARELAQRKKSWMLLSGVNKSISGFGLSLNELKLYIVIAADGSIKHETNLCRIRIKKQHKIKYIKELLNSLNIDYKQYESKSYLSFNFYLPDNLSKLRIKGLDDRVLKCNEGEAEAVFEAYENSDGHRLGNTLLIYSAKEREIDLLQAMFCQNGYMTNKYSRYHGFGVNLQHQLSVTKKQCSSFDASTLTIDQVSNEHFWCVKTRNSTWVMRRNGVVKITGNCHGSLVPPEGLCLDVGLDSAYNILGSHRFFTEEDITEYMKTRNIHINDHHKLQVTT